MRYLITVSEKHMLPATMLIKTLQQVSPHSITIVGNLSPKNQRMIKAFSVEYIDENDIYLKDRWPDFLWRKKYREAGWYKQQLIRLSIDRFIQDEFVVVLDSEVFTFSNWDESRFFDEAGCPRCFYWTPSVRKPAWDYKMYQGAAYLLSFLPECQDIMTYANSDHYKRHISGVVFFSTKNIRFLWEKLERETDLQKNMHHLFNQRKDLAFSDHDFYGLAVDYALFDNCVKTVLFNGLLGWYDTHDDVNFHVFQKEAMWSMCQKYRKYNKTKAYYHYMLEKARFLGQTLPISVNSVNR